MSIEDKIVKLRELRNNRTLIAYQQIEIKFIYCPSGKEFIDISLATDTNDNYISEAAQFIDRIKDKIDDQIAKLRNELIEEIKGF